MSGISHTFDPARHHERVAGFKNRLMSTTRPLDGYPMMKAQHYYAAKRRDRAAARGAMELRMMPGQITSGKGGY